MQHQDPDMGGEEGKDARHVVRLEGGGHGSEEHVPAV